MATSQYKPGGFSNLGATPGMINPTTTLAKMKTLPNQTISQGKIPLPDNNSLLQRTNTPISLTTTSNTSTPQSNISQIGTNSGLINNSPVKKTIQKNVDGSATETHYDTSGNVGTVGAGKNTSGSNLTAGQTQQNNQSQNSTDQSSNGQNNEQTTPTNKTSDFSTTVGNIQNTAAGNIPIGQSAADITAKANEEYNKIGQQGANSELGYSSGQLSPIGQGNALAIANTTAQKQQAVTGGAQLGLTGTAQQLTAQNQAANAYNSAGNLIQPTNQTATGLLTNPVTGETISGNLGSAVTMGTNIKSIQDGQSKINNIDQISGGAKNNLQLAISLANQIPNLNKNVPAVNAITQAIASGLTTSESLPAFQAQVSAVKQAYDSLGIPAEGIADWNNITVNQLTNLAANLDKTVANQKAGIQSNIDSLKSGLGNGTTNSSTSGGSLFSW